MPTAPKAQSLCLATRGDDEVLITLAFGIGETALSLRALVDCGASNNFVRERLLDDLRLNRVERKIPPTRMTVRLATGSTVTVMKRVVGIHYTWNEKELDDDFVVLDLDDKFDVILGMPWLKKYEPLVDWKSRSVLIGDVSRSSSDLMNALVRPLGHGRRKEIGDGHLGHSVARATAQGGGDMRRVTTKKDADCVATQSAQSPRCGESSVKNRVCLPRGQHHCVKKSAAAARRQRRSSSDVMSLTGEGLPATVLSQVEDSSSAMLEEVTETVSVLVNNGERVGGSTLSLPSPPKSASEMMKLPLMEAKCFLRELRKGKVAQICHLVAEDECVSDIRTAMVFAEERLLSSSSMDESVLDDKTRIERFAAQSWESLKSNPVYEDLLEFKDVFPDSVPCELPADKGVRHEIDLVPGTKYCVTRQWPLPREQVEAIDKFFADRLAAGHVRESTSPHSSPTFCVRKATGGWRIVHAFNKLNAATIPAQTPIPRKDVIIDGMAKSTIFSSMDLLDGFYQILMRERDVPYTAVSTPSGMLWEWLVMPQGLSNAPATFNRCVTHLLRPVRAFAPSYFDDVFVHSRAMDGKSEVDVHRIHLRKVLTLMREHKLYANLKKCIFAASEIPVLGCFVGKNGVRPDPEKIKAIKDWPVPLDVKGLRKFLGLAAYLHKYSRNYAAMTVALSSLLKKDVPWAWNAECQRSFEGIKKSLMESPVLAIADSDKPFHVVCDASDFAIGCALMQWDGNGAERVIAYQSRQLQAAERNYPVHDKELLAMKYALAKFRIYLLGDRSFTVYTDHASLRTAVNSPHLSQRMARWLSFFAEYNFSVEYKPGRLNVVADALSRRPDFEPTSEDGHVNTVHVSTPSSTLLDDLRDAYARDGRVSRLVEYLREPTKQGLSRLPAAYRSSVHRYALEDGILRYRAVADDGYRIVVPEDEDLRLRILFEYHDAPVSGHRGREKTYVALARDFYWRRQYQFVRKYVRACETCQRVKSSPGLHAPLHSLPVPTECWESVSMDFIFGFPKDEQGNDGILVFVDRFSKMVHLAAVPETITAEGSARVFVDTVFRLHGLPRDVVSDRDPRFTAEFWQAVFRHLGTQLSMSTADHPETDGQTERTNRVLLEILRGYAHSFSSWSAFLPMVEFAINNSVHASTTHTPFYVNGLRHPRVPSLIGGGPPLSGGGSHSSLENPRDSRSWNDAEDCDGPRAEEDDANDQQSLCGDDHVSPMDSRAVDDVRDGLRDDQVRDGLGDQDVRDGLGDDDDVRDGHHVGTEDRDGLQYSDQEDSMDLSGVETHLAAARGKRAAAMVESAYDFTLARQAVVRFVQDAIASAVDRQKEQADKNGRANRLSFNVGEWVLLSTTNLPAHAVTNVGSNKLLPRYIGPFRIMQVRGSAYTLQLPPKMRTHPTFYVGRLRPYHQYEHVAESGADASAPTIFHGWRCAWWSASSCNRRTAAVSSGPIKAKRRACRSGTECAVGAYACE